MSNPSKLSRGHLMAGRIRASLVVLTQLVLVGVCLTSVLGRLDRYGIMFELMTHFRVQYAALLLIGCALLFTLRSFKVGVLVAVIAVMDVVQIAPYVLPRKAINPSGEGTSIRLLCQNVNTANDRYEDVLAMIKAEDPDVILLLEVDQEWMARMNPLHHDYPHSVSSPRADNFGMAMWSRLELVDTRIEAMTEVRVPMIITEVRKAGKRLRLIGAHPLPPVNSAYLKLRNEQLRSIAVEVRGRPGVSTVVAGDLNTSPWSSAFGDLVRDGGLRDTARGLGLQRTWPEAMWLMRIPIDHVLSTPDVAVGGRHLGVPIGSDHLGVVADLVLRD